jgi:hypothetical protein
LLLFPWQFQCYLENNYPWLYIPLFSHRSLKVLGFKFRDFIHLELIFLKHKYFVLFFWIQITSFLSTSYLIGCLSPVYFSGSFVKNLTFTCCWVYFTRELCCFTYYDYVIWCEIQFVVSLVFLFLFSEKDCFSYFFDQWHWHFVTDCIEFVHYSE